MKNFAKLFNEIDATNKTNEKVDALKRFFNSASDDDKLWAVAILSHRRPKRGVNTTQLREWAAEEASIPLWLFEDTYHVVGDLAETIAKVLPENLDSNGVSESLQTVMHDLKALKKLDDAEKKEKVLHYWKRLNALERFVFNKLITGGFRMGVSQKLMTRALSKHTGIEENILALRLMGDWVPSKTTFQKLIIEEDENELASRPYPFYLAYSKDDASSDLGSVNDWQFEYKWDGIRGQLIKREDEHFVWSRGEELVTDKYPEYSAIADSLPNGTALDGEIIPFENGQPMPFHLLQKRIGRKTVSAKMQKDIPVHFMAYDILEFDGKDIREKSLKERRALLEEVYAKSGHQFLLISEIVSPNSWENAQELRETAREKKAEGLMIKKKDSTYKTGRVKGEWWKWKVDPLTIDGVMIYAMRGHGRRANLYTDFTFAVWKGEELVPFTKAYSGLTDKEMKKVDAFVKKNTIDRFGPVRSVVPELVFEIAFEGINLSSRHKSGVALRFPRIKRWRQDKKAAEANSLSDLFDLIPENSKS